MSAHLSSEVVERFHSQRLTGADKHEIYEHVVGCETCRQRVVTPAVQTAAVNALTDHLLPQAGESFHLDAETIEAFVDDKLNPLDRSTARLHLDDCAECVAEVNDLRESLATMKAMSQADSATHIMASRSRTFSRFSMRIAAAIALIGFVAIALIVIWRLKSARSTEAPPQVAGGYEPGHSPGVNVPTATPSPAASTPRLAENPPPLSPTKDVLVTIKDGPHQITLNRNGKAEGLENLPVESRSDVSRALSGEIGKAPDVLDELTSANVAVRSANTGELPIRLVYPARTVIEENKPTLRWIQSQSASSYQVAIVDENFRQIAKSDLPATASTLRVLTALERGRIYTWSVRAVNEQGQVSEVTSQGKFKVLSADKTNEIARLKRSQSHLALGLFYAQEGMIDKATAELRIVVRQNPDSAVALKLLNTIQSWRKR
jgi:hypothetical protein